MSVDDNLEEVLRSLPKNVTLVAVSKFKPEEDIMQAYERGQRIFGESRAQELKEKYEKLPKDIEWHFIGHLQTNKIKYIAPFVRLIHAVDSINLLKEIDVQAKKHDRVIDCLLEVHISKEDTKFGFTPDGCREAAAEIRSLKLENVRVRGLMGMATFTDDREEVRKEFKTLKTLFDELKYEMPDFDTLSMGMSEDYEIAVEEGATMVRIGSMIFGERQYK